MKRTLRQLMRSAVVCFFCVTLLTSSTYAWVTNISPDPATDDGKPTVELHWSSDYDAPENQWHTTSYDDNNSGTGKLFEVGQGLWEPGYAQVRYIQLDVKNSDKGMTYTIDVNRDDLQNIGDPNLAQVIDVYFIEIVTEEVSRAKIDSMEPICTLAELGVGTNAQGVNVNIQGAFSKTNPLRAALILKMRETADNTYQTKSYDFNLTFDVSQTT